MSTAGLNGTAASDAARKPWLDAQIEEHVGALDALLTPLRAEKDQLKARLDELNAREKAIIHATAALRGGGRPAQTTAAPKAAPAKGSWSPSEESLKRVFELYQQEPEPITPTQLAEKTPGLGTESASKAVKVLRERELLRITGATRGGGKFYTVMDGAEWPAS